jgi:predicted small secreted protein
MGVRKMKIKKAILLCSFLICMMILSACNANHTANQNIEEHETQNEELKLRAAEAEFRENSTAL